MRDRLLRHSPGANRAEDFVGAEASAGREGHLWVVSRLGRNYMAVTVQGAGSVSILLWPTRLTLTAMTGRPCRKDARKPESTTWHFRQWRESVASAA